MARRGRWIIAVASIAVLLSGLLAAVLAPGAHAATYTIDNCPAAPTGNGNPGPWTVFGAPQNTKGSCSGGPGDFIGPLGASMGAATIDGVQVGVPAGSGITIREAKIWWYVPHQISGADTFAMAAVNTGAIEESGTPKNSSSTPDVFVLPSTTTELTLADYCSNDDASNPCVFGSGENPDLQLLGAQLTLADSSLPGGAATGGALSGTGTVAGTAALTYNAQDAGAGVRLVELLVDGQPVAKHDYIAECPYQNFAACPTSVSGELQWETTKASNGTHEVALRVTNAAGNSSLVDDHTLTVTNQLVSASGVSITGANSPLAPHIVNGQSPCAGEELDLEVNGRAKPPTVTYGKPVTIRGVLHCGTVPIRNARIVISTIGGPPSTAIDTTVQTALDGSFSYKVPAGPDRELQFSYTAYSDDPGPSATATAAISVRPRIKLRIGPRHTSNGHVIHWNGTIDGGPFPSRGVTLEVEVREGRHWKVFAQTVAGSKGRFHYSYRFHATTEPATYTFRVALPDTGAGNYPYSSGASNTIRVHVAP